MAIKIGFIRLYLKVMKKEIPSYLSQYFKRRWWTDFYTIYRIDYPKQDLYYITERERKTWEETELYDSSGSNQGTWEDWNDTTDE